MSSSAGEVDFMECTKDTCAVAQSVYGYYPSAAASCMFIIIFGLFALCHLAQGIMTKSWSFLPVLTIRSVLEVTEYAGRVLLRNDPFNDAFIVIHGSEYSRLAPKWYTWIFITSDITSTIVQTIGAILAADGSSTSTGNNIIMAGLASQVFTLHIFSLMASDVWAQIRKHTGEFNESASAMRDSRRFRILISAIVVAYANVLIRCVYGTAKMAGGWANSIMQDHPSFIVLESVMIAVAAVVLNVGHPGFMFVQARKWLGRV
ncbi:hypothetical protein IFR05_001537 [Cadophora sp. M221]|nr:hypothetical protein IFR05_001537 [Cadophora sp. M221]